MPSKPRIFDPNKFYHIYNRGVDKRIIYPDDSYFSKFIEILSYYKHEGRTISYAQLIDKSSNPNVLETLLDPQGLEPRVKVISYCLMPNHFHLVLKPILFNGIGKFLSDVTNSYTRYFNLKNDRSGRLFESTYKYKEVDNDISVLNLTVYVHLNPVTSNKIKQILKPQDYIYSSYKYWVEKQNKQLSRLLDHAEIRYWTNTFGGARHYRRLTETKMGNKPESGIEDLIIENP